MKNATIDLFLRGIDNSESSERNESLSPEFFEELAAACPSLKTLGLEGFFWFSLWSNVVDVSDLPKTIEKLSLAGTTMRSKSASSTLKEMFPHLTEVDLSDYHDFGMQEFFWPWSTGVKKVIMQGCYTARREGFPAPEQQCSIESLDLTNMVPPGFTRRRRKAWYNISGRNMPELKEITLRCTNRKDPLSDAGLYRIFGDAHEDGSAATPLMKLEDLDLRGTAVTGEGMEQD
jgi:hypothetical protein